MKSWFELSKTASDTESLNEQRQKNNFSTSMSKTKRDHYIEQMDVSSEKTKNDVKEGKTSFIWYSNRNKAEIIQAASEGGCNSFTIFFVGKNQNLPSSKPKLLHQELLSIISDEKLINYVKFTRQKQIVINTSSIKCALTLSEKNSILSIPVDTRTCLPELTTQFLLSDIPEDCPLEELAQALEEQNIAVYSLRRFSRSTNNMKVPINKVLVTKLGHSLPDHVKFLYVYHRVSLFIDKPRACTNCYEFTHPTKFCSNITKCGKCGENHKTSQCLSDIIKCCLCGNSHYASDPLCTYYKKEQEILNFKCNKHVSLSEARRIFAKKTKTMAETVKASQSHHSEFVTKSELKNILNENNKEMEQSIIKEFKNQTDNTNFEIKLNKQFQELKKSIWQETNNAILKAIESQTEAFNNNIASILSRVNIQIDSLKKSIAEVVNTMENNISFFIAKYMETTERKSSSSNTGLRRKNLDSSPTTTRSKKCKSKRKDFFTSSEQLIQEQEIENDITSVSNGSPSLLLDNFIEPADSKPTNCTS